LQSKFVYISLDGVSSVASNITIYCLEKITDYFEFERMCHDIMYLEGYHNIEPLGGFKDKGRDAIHVNKDDTVTIFAYSVREDWRAKLAEDADKIRKHNHECDILIFVTTSPVSPGERDEAKNTILQEYDWQLELYSLERLRVLLDNAYSDIKRRYPQIFHPNLLSLSDNSNISDERKYIFISYADSEKPLAVWLARKLTSLGYHVWCYDLPQIGGEFYPEDVDQAIKHHVFAYIAIYSSQYLKNPDLFRRQILASNSAPNGRTDFVMPLQAEDFDTRLRYSNPKTKIHTFHR
jgi:hypothetical protein